MPTTDKAKIRTNIDYEYDSNEKIYRTIGYFASQYYESGIIGGKHFEFYIKNISTGAYDRIDVPSTDELEYYVKNYNSTQYLTPHYEDHGDGNGYGGVLVSNFYNTQKYKYRLSLSSTDYYNIKTNYDLCLRYSTDVNFVIVFVPWRHDFYVNVFSKPTPESFRDLKINQISSSLYNVEVPAPSGMYGNSPDKMIYMKNGSKYELTKDSHGKFIINSSIGNNLLFGFKPVWDLSPACDNETNAARFMEWPSQCQIYFTKFNKPTIKIENDILYWNLSQSDYVQNGYDIYFDNKYYATRTGNSLQIPDKYKLGNHTVAVKVKANSKTVNLGDRRIVWYQTDKGNLVDYTRETVHAFTESDKAELSYRGELSKPIINLSEKIAVNKYAIAWDEVKFAEAYETKLDDVLVPNSNRRVEVTVSQGSHYITIKAYKDLNGIRYVSEITKALFFMPKINQPNNISFTKNVADGGSVFWSRVDEAEAYEGIKEYTLSVNGIDYQTNGNTYILKDLPIGTNELSVKSNFGPDQSYNSEYKIYGFTDDNSIKKLSTPVLSASEIRNSKTNGVEALSLSWKPVSYASGYVLDDYYEVYNDESGLWEGTHIEDDLIATSKEIRFNIGQGVGKHTYKVKAYYKELTNEFTSDYSNIPDKAILEVSKLKPITGLKWKSNNTGKHKDESTLLWNRTQDENYYRVFALKDGESGDLDSKGYVIKTDPSQNSFSFDITNMSVVAKQLTTANYDVYVRCYNYDTLYYQPSEISNRLIYDVIQLNKPAGLKFDNNTQTLSWNKVDKATSYIVYKVGEALPIVETNKLSYTFPDLGLGFFKFYVIAKRTVMEEE